MIMPRFWEEKSLEELTDEEWESLCDGCARCCLIKLEDEDTGKLYYTRVACRLLDSSCCRCTAYAERQAVVSDCLNIRTLPREQYKWLPPTCAYRRIAEGASLPEWHPLLSGDPRSTDRAGFSMRNKCLSESAVHPDDLQEYIVEFLPDGRVI